MKKLNEDLNKELIEELKLIGVNGENMKKILRSFNTIESVAFDINRYK